MCNQVKAFAMVHFLLFHSVTGFLESGVILEEVIVWLMCHWVSQWAAKGIYKNKETRGKSIRLERDRLAGCGFETCLDRVNFATQWCGEGWYHIKQLHLLTASYKPTSNADFVTIVSDHYIIMQTCFGKALKIGKYG